ncbi:hypothetical protein MBANPS3_005125 [Mucor bainieri]
MLPANKFLDDNTFTNKTWSEVSGMKVIDLNIMELEFLDVLRFKLSVQKEEYERWRTALFGFRSQLMGVPVEIQRQKLMETMALSVGNTQPSWNQQQYKHHQVQQQQHQVQHQQQQQQQQQQKAQQQQQQHAAAVAAVTHNFFLFSKAQQQYPVQPTFNGPLTRVPLRIPAQPVYHNIRTTPSAPPNVLTPINVYDNRSNVVVPSSVAATTANGYASTTTTATSGGNISSTSNRRPAAETGYAPYQKQPSQTTPQPRIVASNVVIPSSSSAASSNSNTPLYPQQALPQQQQKPSPFGTPIANQQPFTRSYPSASVTNSNNVTPVGHHHHHPHHHPHHQAPATSSNASNASTRASHRTSSLPSSGGLELNVKNSSYYYATPSATPTNIAYSSTNANSGNNYPPSSTATTTTTSYYVDPTTSMTTPVTAMATSPADYNPYNTANTHTSSAGMTDVYNRPMVPRSTSYKSVPHQQHPQHQLPVTPNGHYMQQQQQHDLYASSQLQTPLQPLQQQQQQQQSAYSGPTLEDPLTAIDSYRAHRH